MSKEKVVGLYPDEAKRAGKAMSRLIEARKTGDKEYGKATKETPHSK